MINQNIFLFAGQVLEKHDYLTPNLLQRHIYNRPEVGKNLPLEDISECLNLMVTCGWLRIVEANNTYTIYRRNLPERSLSDDNILRRVREEYRETAKKIYR